MKMFKIQRKIIPLLFKRLQTSKTKIKNALNLERNFTFLIISSAVNLRPRQRIEVCYKSTST